MNNKKSLALQGFQTLGGRWDLNGEAVTEGVPLSRNSVVRKITTEVTLQYHHIATLKTVARSAFMFEAEAGACSLTLIQTKKRCEVFLASCFQGWKMGLTSLRSSLPSARRRGTSRV